MTGLIFIIVLLVIVGASYWTIRSRRIRRSR